MIAGRDQNRDLKSVERYNVRSEEWERVASVKYTRKNFAAVVFNGNIYAFGKYFFIYLKSKILNNYENILFNCNKFVLLFRRCL